MKLRKEILLRNAACLAAHAADAARAASARPELAAGIASHTFRLESASFSPPLPRGLPERVEAIRSGGPPSAEALARLVGAALGALPPAREPGGEAALRAAELLRLAKGKAGRAEGHPRPGRPVRRRTARTAVQAERAAAAAVAMEPSPELAVPVHREAWTYTGVFDAPHGVESLTEDRLLAALHIERRRFLSSLRWDQLDPSGLRALAARLPRLSKALLALRPRPRTPGTRGLP